MAEDTLPNELWQWLGQASTATVTTQLFKRGLRRMHLVGVRPVSRQRRLMGEALTLRYIPAREDLDVVEVFLNPEHPQRKAIELAQPRQVLVIDARGDTRAASAGHILVTRLLHRGAAGLVTDGALRDSPAIAEMEFPVYAAAASPALNLTVHHAVDINVPIGCGGVPVFPGDVILGDEEAAVVIPRHLAVEVARDAAEQDRLESFILSKVQRGAPLPGTYPPNAQTLEEYRTWSASPEPPDLTRARADGPMDKETAVTDRLERWLREAAVPFQVLEHTPVFTSEEAARVRRTPLEAGAKALVVRADDRYVQVVLPGDRRVDNARLRSILGTRKLRFASPEELLALTGCMPGAVPPFGNLFGLPVLFDEALTRCEHVAFNAGSNAVSIRMRSEDLVRLSGATVCCFALE